MARKSKKKAPRPAPPPPAADGGDATEEESPHSDDGMEVDDSPDIVDGASGGDADDAKEAPAAAAPPKGGEGNPAKSAGTPTNSSEPLPFLDAFYHLSSEDSPATRASAGRALLRHCFPPDGGAANAKDAAYALARLLNGVCTGRAASRQGFAACLASFLKAARSSGALGDILAEDECASKPPETGDAAPAAMVRRKLLATTQFLPDEAGGGDGGKGKKKKEEAHRVGGKARGIEERDHAFGRLFGIEAVVRSGTLGADDVPSSVVEGYARDLVDLYRYKTWMREPAAHAIVELVASLDAAAKADLVGKATNNVLVPELFLASSVEDGAAGRADWSDRSRWLSALTPEQIAVALHLQTLSSDDGTKYDYPLDEPLLTAASVPVLAPALASTSHVVYPRCHIVWDALWMHLTEKNDGTDRRALRSDKEFPVIVESIVQHVVLDVLLGKGEGRAAPTHERRSLALQLVCALCGSSNLNIALPPDLVGTVLCPDVVTRAFVNVLCASGGKKPNKEGAEHHLKPLTSKALEQLVERCCGRDDVDRRMAVAKAFLSTDPRFDAKTKTRTVGSLLMLDDDGGDDDGSERTREALWDRYASFLEEEVVSATSLHNATVYVELMYKLAKRSLAKAPAAEARRVVRFFVSGAFFDCSGLVDPSAVQKKPSKKKRKDKGGASTASSPPQELSSGLRIKELLRARDVTSVAHPARALMSARFYSLLSDFVSVISVQNRGGHKGKSFYNGKGSKPESIYRALSEICGICTLLETSGATMLKAPSDGMDGDDASDAEDPTEASKRRMLRVQNVANDALVEECDGAGGEEALRAKAAFATGCASLMLSLFLQLNSCGAPEASDGEKEDEEDEDVAEAVHEYISELADCVDGFLKTVESAPGAKKLEDDENPLAAMAGLLVNILSSPVGGEGSGKTSPVQASASKLTRETVKLAWSGTISMITALSKTDDSLTKLVDEDVMSILIESVCGEKSMADEDEEGDEESTEASASSVNDAVFVDATKSGMDLDEEEDNSASSTESEGQSSQDSSDEGDDDDVELDPAKLENLLLEDSDAEMEGGVLEHHAGADKALAQLIKMKQDARKASQTERERVDLCNRLRCVGLLESLFSASVFKSGWLPVEAVLGSIVPLLRSRKALAKSIQASSSTAAKKSLSEKNALVDRISSLVKDKISKFRCADGTTSEEVALKAAADIFEEVKHSLNVAHCSCSSVALITTARCIPDVEDSAEVKDIYAEAVVDWSTRKASKIHACVFHDLIQRMPSLAPVVLLEPLLTSAKNAHSPFLKCESVKLLSAIYKHDTPNPENFSVKATSTMKEGCSKVVSTLKDALGDSTLQKAKHRDEVLSAIKQVAHFVKAQDTGILTDPGLSALQESLNAVDCKSAGMKQLCSQVSETIAGLARRVEGNGEQKTKRSKKPKTPKTSKKAKKSKK